MWFIRLCVKGLLVFVWWEVLLSCYDFLSFGVCDRWLMLALWLMSMLACCVYEGIMLS